MPDYPPKLAELVDLLSLAGGRSERIQLLIDTAERFRDVPACESEAYVWAEPLPDGTLKYHFAVENPQGISAKALAVILDETLSGQPPEEVARVPGDLIYDVFGRELSMGKSMGLMGMVAMVARSAKAARTT
jgi:cysteine desulfuration protein SufE